MVAAVVGSMMAKRVDGGVGGDVADGVGGVPALGIALTLIFLWKRQLSAGACVMWKRRKFANQGWRGSRSLRSRISPNVAMPQHTPRRALEKFRRSAADPAFAERRMARIASSIKNVREIEMPK